MNLGRTIIFCVLWVASHADADEAFYVFAPDAGRKRVVCLSVDDATDRVSVKQHAALSLPFGPNSIVMNYKTDRLYATSAGKNNGHVASIALSGDGRMELIESASLGHPAGYTSVDRTDRFFLSANYSAGVIAVRALKANGAIGEVTCSLKTPRSEAHCIATSPDNRFAYVPCVKNNNALYQFAFNQESGKLQPLKTFDARPPAMFGPRHYVYHPTLRLIYFSNEQQLGVSVFEIPDDGQLNDIQHATTMPRRSPFQQGKRDLHASDLVISRDGRWLFVAVRDFNGDEDSVFAFAVQDDGKLRLLARTKVGDIPWKLALSPSGNLLLVSESGDRKLGVYRIDAQGSLTLKSKYELKSTVRDLVVRPFK